MRSWHRFSRFACRFCGISGASAGSHARVAPASVAMSTAVTCQRLHLHTAEGAEIFRLPLEAFPGFWSCAYLVLVDDLRVLIDTGSGVDSANEGLEAGFRWASEVLGKPITFGDLTHIFITHGHIDHFGGLAFLAERTEARIGVHELARRTLTNYEERLTVASSRLGRFLTEAGVPPERRETLLAMYQMPKAFFRSVRVDFTYEAEGMRVGAFRMLHVPGHCPGHVVIRLHDVLFVGDHILDEISPHQSPESITLSTGLGHYLESLARVEAWLDGVRVALGGHKRPVEAVAARIAAIRTTHRERLNALLGFLETPHTVAEASRFMFGDVNGYNVLLALSEAGAHVEYLYTRGFLGIANLAEVEANPETPLRYYRLVRTGVPL